VRIASAFVTREEVEPLIAAGADELYCRVDPGAFAAAPDVGRLCRGDAAAMGPEDLAELTEVVACAAALSVPVTVVVDEPACAASTIPSLVALAGKLTEAGVRALSVADPALIVALRSAGLPLELEAAASVGCRNSEAVAFFAELGVGRIVLPAGLSLAAIAAVCGVDLSVEFQVPVMNGGDGLAGGPGRGPAPAGGARAGSDWRAELRAATVAPELAADWEESWGAYRFLVGIGGRAGAALSRGGHPLGPCGLCALPALRDAGVDVVGVGGLGRSPEARVGGVWLVRATLNWVERGDPPEHVVKNATGLKGTLPLCDTNYACCFPSPRRAAGPPRRLADLDAAIAGAAGNAPAAARPPAAAPAPAPTPAPTAGPALDDPEVRRLRLVAEALAAPGMDLRWSGASFALSFPDADQPGGTSCVIVAKVDEAVRCYARSGNLGVWHEGHIMTPRIAQVIKGLCRVLELIPA
jgi:U32 family peptidase